VTRCGRPAPGLIVTGPDDVLLSGPMVKSEFASTPTDPDGTVSFEGVSDTVCLADCAGLPTAVQPGRRQSDRCA
jgi:hypothetical protein